MDGPRSALHTAMPVEDVKKPRKSRARPSRAARWRATALIALNLLMIAHIIQWRLMGTTVSPIEPAEAMYTLQRGAINAGLIYFSLAILTTLLLGRFFCGWACHMVALQDLCAWLLNKIGLRPKPFRSRLLVYIPLAAGLYMFVWPTAARYFTKAAAEPLIPQFTNQLMTRDMWATFPPVSVAIPFLFICGFLTVYFLGSKGFCTYACPYGGFYKLFDRFSPGKIRVTDACDQCGHCTDACTSNVSVHREVKQFGMVVDPNCHRQMDCVSVCPQDALYFGFGKPSIAAGGTKKQRKAYSLTWPEEIFAAGIFIASYLAVWNVYQLVPMLMSLGIALVTTYLAVVTARFIVLKDLAFYNVRLRAAGKMTLAGGAFLIFSFAWIGLNAHSGWVRFNERRGDAVFQRISVPDEIALAQKDPSVSLSTSDKHSVALAREYFEAASAAGFFVNDHALPKHAWVEFLGGNADKAIGLLGAAAERSGGPTRALFLYYRGSILNRLGRSEQALANLDAALVERTDLSLARVEKGESLWALGNRTAAVNEWSEATADRNSSALAHLLLAGAAAADGDMALMAEHEGQAEIGIPKDARFHWMLGLRLQNIGMHPFAGRQFARAISIDPAYRYERR